LDGFKVVYSVDVGSGEKPLSAGRGIYQAMPSIILNDQIDSSSQELHKACLFTHYMPTLLLRGYLVYLFNPEGYPILLTNTRGFFREMCWLFSNLL
jgi:hypothetical protein